MNILREYVAELYKSNRYPDQFLLLEKKGNNAKIYDKRTDKTLSCLNFCANDLFSLTSHPEVINASIDAIKRYGTSNSGSYGLNGKIAIHAELEQAVGELKGPQHTHLFINAWAGSASFFNAFCHHGPAMPGYTNTKSTLILADILSHGSLMTAANNAKNPPGHRVGKNNVVEFWVYRHLDAVDLKKQISKRFTDNHRLVVVTDSVFSMDGDYAPIDEIVDVMSCYEGSVLFIDEAHGTGSMGATGKGILEHFGMTTEDIKRKGVEPVILTTFSKFAASAGAAISTYSKELAMLMNVTPSSIATISIPPAQAAAALESIKILNREGGRLKELLDKNTAHIREGLVREGFDVLGDSAVIPVILAGDVHPQDFARELLYQHSIWVSPVWYIAKPRIRIVANTNYTESEIARLIDAMCESRESLISRPRVANNG